MNVHPTGLYNLVGRITVLSPNWWWRLSPCTTSVAMGGEKYCLSDDIISCPPKVSGVRRQTQDNATHAVRSCREDLVTSFLRTKGVFQKALRPLRPKCACEEVQSQLDRCCKTTGNMEYDKKMYVSSVDVLQLCFRRYIKTEKLIRGLP